MWQEIVTLFVAMEPIPAILLTVGIIFCIIEMFIPGVGFFGISGSIAILAGIVLRFIRGFNLTQLFILVLILCVVFTLAGLIVVRSSKKGLLSRSPLINNKTAIPVQFENPELDSMVGKQGKVTIECKPLGKAEIEGNEYEVLSNGEYLIVGVSVEVLENNGNVLVVKKLDIE